MLLSRHLGAASLLERMRTTSKKSQYPVVYVLGYTSPSLSGFSWYPTRATAAAEVRPPVLPNDNEEYINYLMAVRVSSLDMATYEIGVNRAWIEQTAREGGTFVDLTDDDDDVCLGG